MKPTTKPSYRLRIDNDYHYQLRDNFTAIEFDKRLDMNTHKDGLRCTVSLYSEQRARATKASGDKSLPQPNSRRDISNHAQPAAYNNRQPNTQSHS